MVKPDAGGETGGGGGIRTHDTVLPYTHFPGVRLRPLGHSSNARGIIMTQRATARNLADRIDQRNNFPLPSRRNEIRAGMLLLRILALLSTTAAVVFGSLQLIDHVAGNGEVITLWTLWRDSSPDTLQRLLTAIGPDRPWSAALRMALSLPAWISCLVLALALWLPGWVRGGL